MTKLGICGRNSDTWPNTDIEAILQMRLGWLKMMSQTDVKAYEQLRAADPNIKFIVRLYDDRFTRDGHPTPPEFVQRISPTIARLKQFTNIFQVHNEPNHLARIEGWGDTCEDAESFTSWFFVTYMMLKSRFPDCLFGFPPLAVPHNDMAWLEWCKPAIIRADWLGVHCYWQNPTEMDANHLDEFWGQRFIQYHAKFPDKQIYILEAGNSNHQNGYYTDDSRRASEFQQLIEQIERYDYIRSFCPFILSSPDPTWQPFCWMDEAGRQKEMVRMVRNRQKR